MTTVKQANWLLHKERVRLERKRDRGVRIDPTVREKKCCSDTCNHSRKHHKKTGRCRGKIPTDRLLQGHEIAKVYGVPARLIGLPRVCDCKAGVR
jgi:hypothetical protein